MQTGDENMATEHGEPVPSDADADADRRLREIYTFECPWNTYALAWSNRSDQLFRLAVGSCVVDYANEVRIVQLVQGERGLELESRGSFEHSYPPTKVMWHPSPSTSAPDLLATTGDYLRLWEVSQLSDSAPPKIELRSFLNNNRKTDFCAPLTSFDWNRDDPRILATCSVDTTVRVWDLDKEQTSTQLIAHEKEVNDIAFARGAHVFATVGSDGSVRLFDLRSLDHSNILHETDTPILRVGWNTIDTNYLACFGDNARAFAIVDIRNPASPITPRTGHNGPVNAIHWAPQSASHVGSAGEDGQVLIWDVGANGGPTPSQQGASAEPILAYSAGAPVNNMDWCGLHYDWIAIAYGSSIQTLRV